MATVSAYISYFLKATNGKYYANILVSDYEFFVEVAYFNLSEHLGKSIRVNLEAFEKPKQFTVPAYNDRPARKEKALGIIKKPITKAGAAELQKILGAL